MLDQVNPKARRLSWNLVLSDLECRASRIRCQIKGDCRVFDVSTWKDGLAIKWLEESGPPVPGEIEAAEGKGSSPARVTVL